jgi:hypothetical protein
MQRNFLLKAALIFLLMAGSFIALWSSSSNKTTAKACTETMEECSKANEKNNAGEMILETISRQFFSTTEISD